jgi:hypothetical protein
MSFMVAFMPKDKLHDVIESAQAVFNFSPAFQNASQQYHAHL